MPDELGGAVGGRTVHHDDLEVGHVLSNDRVETGPDEPFLVARWDRYGHQVVVQVPAAGNDHHEP
jgi:hypothetical protein